MRLPPPNYDHHRTPTKKASTTNEEDDYYAEVSLLTQCASEFMGTFVMVVVGCGAECIMLYIDSTTPGTSTSASSKWLALSLVWIIGSTLGIYSAASISSGHLNPAVTLSFAIVRPDAVPFRKVVPYWIAQICGALVAGMTNMLLFHRAIQLYEEKHMSEACPVKSRNKKNFVCTEADRIYLQSASAFGKSWSLSEYVTDVYHAFFIEFFGTAFVVFIIFIVTSPLFPIPGPAVPPIVALSIGGMIAVLGPLTGANMNPARDLGPRLVAVSMHWGTSVMADHLPYLLGPLLGGPVGGWFAEAILHMT